MTQHHKGSIAATLSFTLWGFLPIYWKALSTVPALEILCHRMVWSLLFTMGLITILGRLGSLKGYLRDVQQLKHITVAAVVLAGNWLMYIWAVNSGHVLEASLGYFINPLVLVLFGVVFMKEKLRLSQYGALFIALCGVLYLTFFYGKVPWIALCLASTFAVYGFLHKKSSLPAIEGLCIETVILSLPAFAFIFYLELGVEGSFLAGDSVQTTLLIGTGLATSLPLLFFGYAAQRIPLSLLGLFQYIAPTINLFLGIFLYHEAFPPERMIGFVLIWVALIVYRAESMWQNSRQQKRITVSS